MVRSPEYLALLAKYGLKPDADESSIVETAKSRLVSCPSNQEPVILAYGHIPETMQEFDKILKTLDDLQQLWKDEKGRTMEGPSLFAALFALQQLGKQKDSLSN